MVSQKHHSGFTSFTVHLRFYKIKLYLLKYIYLKNSNFQKGRFLVLK